MTYGIWPEHSEHLCSYNFDTQSCDYVDYGLRMGFAYFFPGIAFAILFTGIGVVLFAIYGCCRCCRCFDCCNWCYWLNCLNWCNLNYIKFPSLSGFCFRKARLWRGVMAVLAVFSVIFLLVAIGVDVDVNEATTSWREDTRDFIQGEIDDVNDGIATIKGFTFYPRIASSFDSISSEVQSVIDKAQTLLDKTDDLRILELSKFIVEIVFVALVCLLCAGGCIVAALGWKIPYLIYAAMILIALVPLFLFFSYNVLSEQLYADVCEDNDITIAGGNSAIKNGILPCNSSEIISARAEYNYLLNVTGTYVCEPINAECTLPYIYCGTYICTNNTVFQAPTAIVVDDFLVCGDANCSITCSSPALCYRQNYTELECSTECRNTNAKNVSQFTVTSLDDLSEFYAIMEDTFLPILTCNIVTTYDLKIKNDLCDRMINVGIVALFIMFAGVAMILAAFWTILAHNTLSEGKDKDEDWDMD